MLKTGDHIVFNSQKGTVGFFNRPGSFFPMFGSKDEDTEFFIGRKVAGDLELAGKVAHLIANTHGLSSGIEKNDLPNHLFFKLV